MRKGVEIARDSHGVPHVAAYSEADAWHGLGHACAEDRLWQMEVDRRRATGRLAELVGVSGLAGDKLARRLQLKESAVSDVAGMSAGTRDAFEAFAEGVNAYVKHHGKPAEFSILGLEPEPWEIWHSVAIFKIRHVMMGTWQAKIARARLLALAGPAAIDKLQVGPPAGTPSIVPPGGSVGDLYRDADDDFQRAELIRGFGGDAQSGSNSWAIAGARTESGRPLICNDSHRLLELPNVYWQAGLECRDFKVVGVCFPGVPGFTHFGYNGWVAWNVTHAMADYQDLYLESFGAGDDPSTQLAPGAWAKPSHHKETIRVRGEADHIVEVWRTHHGPVVHGDPRSGNAVSLRYTATDEACSTFEVIRPMLMTKTVPNMLDSQRDWIDPVNNFVCADADGNIGYLLRGVIPVRSSSAHRGLPAIGWTGEHEWVGRIEFHALPRMVNPDEGFIVTANNAILEEADPYISFTAAEPFRAERIREQLLSLDSIDEAGAAALQMDVTSTAARRWVTFLSRQERLSGHAESARQLLAAWNARLSGDSGEVLLYGCFRREVSRALFEPIVGSSAWEWLHASPSPSHEQIVRRWLGNVVAGVVDGTMPPDGSPWKRVLQDALESAWQRAVELAGNEPAAWRWGVHHVAGAMHPLSPMDSDSASDLPRVEMGGDEDTVQCAGYTLRSGAPFDVALLSVYRQVIDFDGEGKVTWIIPGGASGRAESPHHHDQLAPWGDGKLVDAGF